MDLATVEQLTSPAGRALLEALPPYDEAQTLALSAGLRERGIDPGLAAAALTQTRLREKARAKLGPFADGMLFTPEGLEQATRLVVAARHAQRYLAAGTTRVADLTCGLGADALAFAGVGLRVLATDVDPATAALAAHNLRAFPEAEVRCADGLALDLAAEGVDGVYADPMRRTRTGTRVLDPAAYAPPLDAVWSLRDAVPALGIKVGPGIAHAGLPDDAETQWVSVDGDVVEAALWFGPLAPRGPGRTALVLRSGVDGRVAGRELRGPRPGEEDLVADVGPVGTYLYEPDGAVIRAGLVAQVAAETGGRLLDPTIAYVTSDAGPQAASSDGTDVPAATAYRVLDVMPFGLKRLKAYLRENGVGRVTIKKRGTAVTPEQLRRDLGLKNTPESAEATLVLTRVAGRQSVLVVEPATRA
ncbi:methyltransferase domain-containing protein [Luteimicrobium sp. NPDC057192]|uniref:class I SAM-dependent methyltransferase n=1 Tax=Luteimicrobium sp. NPDC057192 TaxID=3346042 RepID=UPI003631FFA2